MFCSVGSRSNSSSSFYCYCLCCRWMFRPLIGTCQVQSKWNASGFFIWHNLSSIPTGKILSFLTRHFTFIVAFKNKPKKVIQHLFWSHQIVFVLFICGVFGDSTLSLSYLSVLQYWTENYKVVGEGSKVPERLIRFLLHIWLLKWGC